MPYEICRTGARILSIENWHSPTDQLNLSVCFSEALNFATWFANVISSGEGIRTGKVGGIDLIIANILSENVPKR